MPSSIIKASRQVATNLFLARHRPKGALPPGKGCFRHAGRYKQVVWLGFNILF